MKGVGMAVLHENKKFQYQPQKGNLKMDDYVHDTVMGYPDTQTGYWEGWHFSANCETITEGCIIKPFDYDCYQDQFVCLSAVNGGCHMPRGRGRSEAFGRLSMEIFLVAQ